MKKEKSCGAVVFRREGERVLFLLEHMVQGHISLPKGHVESGETEAETALREIREETGLEAVLDTSFRHVITYSPAPGKARTWCFSWRRPCRGRRSGRRARWPLWSGSPGRLQRRR